jgi:hypothetical protein
MLYPLIGSTETSYHGVDIRTTPFKLIQLCEKYDIPFFTQNDGEDKTNFDFAFNYNDELKFFVYDWKEYRPLSLSEYVDFHIGTTDRNESDKALNILINEINELED